MEEISGRRGNHISLDHVSLPFQGLVSVSQREPHNVIWTTSGGDFDWSLEA